MRWRGAVVALAARSEDALKTVADQCRALGGRALVAPIPRARGDVEGGWRDSGRALRAAMIGLAARTAAGTVAAVVRKPPAIGKEPLIKPIVRCVLPYRH